MTNYKLEDFKFWLEVTFQNQSVNWTHWLYYPEDFFDKVVRGENIEASDGSNKEAIEAIKQWMKATDQGEFHSPLLNKKQELEKTLATKLEEIIQLTQELITERETTQQALQTSQEWHERQKGEIIAEWKEKFQNLIQQRKTSLTQEITLLREILSHE